MKPEQLFFFERVIPGVINARLLWGTPRRVEIVRNELVFSALEVERRLYFNEKDFFCVLLSGNDYSWGSRPKAFLATFNRAFGENEYLPGAGAPVYIKEIFEGSRAIKDAIRREFRPKKRAKAPFSVINRS